MADARSPRALVISPVGSGYEPLGALRRALARSVVGGVLNPLLLELSDPLDALLAGKGISLEITADNVIALERRSRDDEGSFGAPAGGFDRQPAPAGGSVRPTRSPSDDTDLDDLPF